MALGILRILGIQVELNGFALQGHQIVLRRVDGNPVKPCVERTFTPESRQGPVGLHEGLLGDVESFGRIAHVSHDKLQYFLLVLEYQQVEGAPITPLNSLYEKLIAACLCHARGPVWDRGRRQLTGG